MKNVISFSLVCLIAACWLENHAAAQELEPLGDEAQDIGKDLVEGARGLDSLTVRLDVDLDQAHGVHVPGKLGAALIPERGLKENEEFSAKLDEKHGAPLAYLFLYHVAPVVDGKKVDPSELHAFTINRDGAEHRVHLLILTAKRVAPEDYRLYGYGTEEKPLVDARFGGGEAPSKFAVALDVAPGFESGVTTMTVTVFGKYQAKFKAGYVE